MKRLVIDSHVHLMSGPDDIDNLCRIKEATGADKMCVMSLIDPENVNENPDVFAAKLLDQDGFYAFAAMDHSAHFSSGKITSPSLSEQIDTLLEIGADGVKLLETKPDRRKLVDIPIDSGYYEGMFARLEAAEMPVLWHVADPPEFWDPDLTPKWAAEKGWGYDETFIRYEQLYDEVGNVLNRHPGLKVIFPHFFFLTGDLSRAEELLRMHKNVYLDLAPGIEMLYNLSKNTKQSRDFFIAHSGRIIYGTDIWAAMSIDEALHRAGIIRRWLETDEEYRLPDGADFLLGPPEDGVIKGMELPEDVLCDIYFNNIERLVGSTPRPVNQELLTCECSRIIEEKKMLRQMRKL